MNVVADLRSDTVTKPTPAMRQAMADAVVGDDVIDVDPTVQELESEIAALLGKQAALFMPSGTMSNQIAVRIHCKPGDDFICEEGCHILNYEQGAYAQLSGVAARAVTGSQGSIELDCLRGMLRPDNEHLTRTRLLCLENTHNRASGKVQSFDLLAQSCDWAHENGLRTHLDGARLFNAVAAGNYSAAQWAERFDTVSVCFSKGLGAPVGSALVGSKEMKAEARRHRKLFGGGMRQAGIIAAGALHALRNHRERLADDHANAQRVAEGVRATDGLELSPDRIDTNILFFTLDPAIGTAADFVAGLEDVGVRMLPVGQDRIRAVTHLDVDEAGCRRAAELIPEVAARLRAGERPATANVAAY